MRPERDEPTRPGITPEQRRSNQRLGLILGAVALAIFIGFIVKSALYGI